MDESFNEIVQFYRNLLAYWSFPDEPGGNEPLRLISIYKEHVDFCTGQLRSLRKPISGSEL